MPQPQQQKPTNNNGNAQKTIQQQQELSKQTVTEQLPVSSGTGGTKLQSVSSYLATRTTTTTTSAINRTTGGELAAIDAKDSISRKFDQLASDPSGGYLLKTKSGVEEPNNNEIISGHHQRYSPTEQQHSSIGAGSPLNALRMDTTASSYKRPTASTNGQNNTLESSSKFSNATTATSAASYNTLDSTDSHNKLLHQDHQERPTIQIPTYTSIFAPNSNSSYHHQQQQQVAMAAADQLRRPSAGRGQLRKQLATETTEHLNRSSLASGKRPTTTTFDYGSEEEEDDDDDDYDDDMDDEVSEKLPFSSATKLNAINTTTNNNNTHGPSDKRISSESHGKYQKPTTKHPASYGGGGKREGRTGQTGGGSSSLYKKPSAPHTKISFNESNCPPSFNTCHNEKSYECRKLNLLEQAACLNCDCQNCYKKRRKLAMNDRLSSSSSNYYIEGFPGYHEKKYPRTRAMHLVLKSIVLLLCTLLLLLLLVGTIIASHYLPQAFDRILNVSRSFNVTIAG